MSFNYALSELIVNNGLDGMVSYRELRIQISLTSLVTIDLLAQDPGYAGTLY